MKLWRLTRSRFAVLDGEGARLHGGRYTSPGLPVVSLASEAGLAVLVALRYVAEPTIDDYVLGWIEVDVIPERIDDDGGDDSVKARADNWLSSRRSLLAAVRSKVLPEADVVLLNPLHSDFGSVPPLTIRPFSFAECLHRPPMLDRFRPRLRAH